VSLYVFVAWAFILTFNTGLLLWDITGLLAPVGTPETAFGWLSLAVAFVAPFGFGASVYGLWYKRPWGRYLFVALSTVFFSLNLIAAWLPNDLLSREAAEQVRAARLLSTARNSLGLIIPLIYFNLRRIKGLFQESRDQDIRELGDQEIGESGD
jgi:hypothetical protein